MPDIPPNGTSILPELLEAWKRSFERALPRIKAHARVYFRDCKDEAAREEAVAETIALAWKQYRRLYERGKKPDNFLSALAGYSARQVRCGRRVAGQEKARDVMSPLAQRRKGFSVRPLPEHDSGSKANELIDALRDNTHTPPPDQAAFRIDYPKWLERLGERDGSLAADMATGESTKNLAGKYAMTDGRVSQLRREFSEDWDLFHGEPPIADGRRGR